MMPASIGRRLVLILSLVLSCSGSARPQVPEEFPLTLNEIDPAGGEEFIELHNRSAEVLFLEEYSLEMVNIDGTKRGVVQLPQFRLAPGGFFAVFLLEGERDRCPAEPETNSVCLQFLDRNLCPIDLDRDGGRVGLRRRNTIEVESVRYPRPPRDSLSYGRNSGGGWCILVVPSPGAANDSPCIPSPRVVLNEISTAERRSDRCFEEGCPDWVEILWLGGSEVDLSKEFVLSDRDPGHVYLFDDPVVDGFPNPILNEDHPRVIVLLLQNRSPGWSREYFHAPFGLKTEGDSLSLHVRPDPNMNRDITDSYDSVTIPRNDERNYLARVPDGGAWRINDTSSPGSENEAAGIQGIKPDVRIIDRFPLRVFFRENDDPAAADGQPIEIFVRALDQDDDLAAVELVVEGAGHPAGGRVIPMEPGRAVTCDGEDPERERGVFVAWIDRPLVGDDESVKWVVKARATDRAGQSAESGPHTVFLQRRDWDPGDGTQYLRINEVAADDRRGDWLELYNPTVSIIDAGGLYLTNDILSVVDDQRQFPFELILGPGEFRLIWCDGAPADAADRNLHLPFVLDECRDEVILLHSDGFHVIDVVPFHEEKSGITLGRFPDGADTEDRRDGVLTLMTPSPEQPNLPPEDVSCVDFGPPGDDLHLVINEVIADNWASGADAGGENGDWIELYNPTGEVVNLDGWTLRDRAIIRRRHQPPWSFPPGSRIAPDCFLLIWCDDGGDDEHCENRAEPGTVFCEDPSEELHTNFAINRRFDYVQLRDPCGQIVDCVTVRYQARDVAAGRFPNGVGRPALLVPTPGAPNEFLQWAGCALDVTLNDEFEDDDDAICRFQPPRSPCVLFKRGDADSDCKVRLNDAVYVLGHLFNGGPAPTCPDAADANDSGSVEITDAIFILRFLFSGGPRRMIPPGPGPFTAGADRTPDPLPLCLESGCE